MFHFESLWFSNADSEKVEANARKDRVGEKITVRMQNMAGAFMNWVQVTFGDIQKRIVEPGQKPHNLQEKPPDGAILEQCHSVGEQVG